MERSARSRLEKGRKAEKEESRKKKRLLVSSFDPLTSRIFIRSLLRKTAVYNKVYCNKQK